MWTFLGDTVYFQQANHTIDWKKTTIIDREDRPTRWIKEAVHIRKKGHRAMNRDEGSYQLSHDYNRLPDATADRRIKTRKNWLPASSDKDLVMRSKRQNNVLKFWLWYINFLLAFSTHTVYRYIYLLSKAKRIYQFRANHLNAIGNHIPHGITHLYHDRKFSDPTKMQGWVDLGGCYIPRKFTRQRQSRISWQLITN